MKNELTLKEEVLLNYIATTSENITKFMGKNWVECSCQTVMSVLRAERSTAYRTLKKLESKGYILRNPQRLHGSLNTASFCLTDKSRSLFFGSSSGQKNHIYNKASSFIFINHNKSKCPVDKKTNRKRVTPPTPSNQLGLFCEFKPATTIVQDMFKIWREEFGDGETLDKRLARWFVSCFNKVFHTLERWREYVKRLRQSSYIMNKMRECGYFLRWALSFKVINKIFDGGFGVGVTASSGWTSPSGLRSSSGGASSSGETSSWVNNQHLVTNQHGVETSKGDKMKRESKEIDEQTLSNCVRREFAKYKNDKPAQDLLRKFLDFHGRYKLAVYFKYATIHLRGKRLVIYFANNFLKDYFDTPGNFERFKEYCEKSYDFETKTDSSVFVRPELSFAV